MNTFITACSAHNMMKIFHFVFIIFILQYANITFLSILSRFTAFITHFHLDVVRLPVIERLQRAHDGPTMVAGWMSE